MGAVHAGWGGSGVSSNLSSSSQNRWLRVLSGPPRAGGWAVCKPRQCPFRGRQMGHRPVPSRQAAPRLSPTASVLPTRLSTGVPPRHSLSVKGLEKPINVAPLPLRTVRCTMPEGREALNLSPLRSSKHLEAISPESAGHVSAQAQHLVLPAHPDQRASS